MPANTSARGEDAPLPQGSPPEAVERAGGRGFVYVAAALSLAAALIHLWAMPEHLEEWWGYGAFFLAAATAQALYAALLPRWSSPVILLLGIYGNLAIVVLYVVTRTLGVPFFGPHAWEVEPVGVLDTAATVAELGLVVVLVTGLRGRYRETTIGVLLLLGIALWALRLTGALA